MAGVLCTCMHSTYKHVCACMYMYVCIHVCMHAHIHMDACRKASDAQQYARVTVPGILKKDIQQISRCPLNPKPQTNACMYVCLYVCMYVCMYSSM